jgi:hypothetical protein
MVYPRIHVSMMYDVFMYGVGQPPHVLGRRQQLLSCRADGGQLAGPDEQEG